MKNQYVHTLLTTKWPVCCVKVPTSSESMTPRSGSYPSSESLSTAPSHLSLMVQIGRLVMNWLRSGPLSVSGQTTLLNTTHPWLIEWAPGNKEDVFSIPPGTTHFADHDCSDAYHSMKCSEAAKNMGCSKYRASRQQEVVLEPQCYQQDQASSAAYFSPWDRYG